MEAGNTLNRLYPPASAAVLPVFGTLRRFLCISGSWTMLYPSTWLNTAFSPCNAVFHFGYCSLSNSKKKTPFLIITLTNSNCKFYLFKSIR